ncbi:MAG: MarR family winged helix-turn-helix transcriptional regulator [Ectobacillus sp.]
MHHYEWESIVNHLLSLVPLFYRKFMLPNDSASQKHMPQSHIQVLVLLDGLDTLTISEIGDRLSISRPNMTPLLNKLIEKGYIKRHYSTKDRRVILISLTQEGKAFISTYKQLIINKLKENLEILSVEEQQQFCNSLETIQTLIPKLQTKL